MADVVADEAELGDEQFMYVDSCPAQWEALPRPDGPITVGIDGGYVRDWEHKQTHFEVIVGKSLPRDGPDKYVGFGHHTAELGQRIDIAFQVGQHHAQIDTLPIEVRLQSDRL